ncbi:3-hydroxyacyl-CoA dehydrogenase NAD-binding domain-containing protein [Amycolatopsis acidiphila]|uniref:3-hydroxyacyl-CoA dehydrogenase n=1 Tax=Amycolatopsis acidiphila TaxID=715473 RepID=A0A558AHU6_9PSEU|nr:3-hydroxyacyl-CoA dehydrogenase NAD-binding domain-containing protein [Amycolatopsis acidiphila]TVT23844.1 3-hydroxyacyl-CoA dehydrogenase [Amycolatopsis acidiphila]UIJ61180.1 3-hydroxyacyl-CoA dehydrogenase NAD-binding domain-containing protein [Amycolatopsis acidiphila]GHG86272.1 3-hydroxyacyl-CoA dehydrogenase [Amycolatopsis acidiphila]
MTEHEHPMFLWDRGDDGVVTVTMDDPDGSANTMNERFRREFPVLVEHLHAERDSITGVIIGSAKKTFFAGGDLGMMMRATRDQVADITAMLEAVKHSLRRLETLGRPVVAAINGAALGGGYEIALACHHRIAVDASHVRVGLPEVTLGLLPGGGGTTRTVRMFGLQTALQDILLTGRKFRPAAAVERGLLDAVVSGPAELATAAREWIAANPEPAQPWDRPGHKIPGGTPASPGLAAVLPSLPAVLRKQNHGAPAPAPHNLLAAAVEGAQVDFDNALIIESRYCADLICGQVSANIIKSMFFDMRAIDRGASRPDGHPPYEAKKVVVLGAGMMGAGIAYVSAKAGLDVVLKDVTLDAAERGKGYSAKILDKAVQRGTTTPEQRDALLGRITPTADAPDADGADLLIEAVFEDPSLKKKVIAEIAEHLTPDAVLGSNTSTLPITDLAEGVTRPEDFIGLHFFSPVDKMALLEIVVGEKTSDATLAKAIDFARQIGKTPIVVNDSRGFFTSRVILEFVNEAIALLGEGVPAASIEQAATQAGYPVGALALVDELALTLLRKIREETAEGYRAAGVDQPVHPAAAVVDRMIDEFDRTGRAAGAGFYDYDKGRRQGLWAGLAEAFDGTNTDVPLIDMQERMLFSEALDTIRCLDEGVLRSIPDANVGSILGIGFPSWTGGVIQYVNQYEGGLPGFVARARELAARYGERFTPPASLVRKSENGEDYQ